MSSDKYNKKRKRILEELDKGKEVSIMELGMYDLTPYFRTDEFDVSLSESIMLNKNFERKIEHVDKELFFSPPQYKALGCLFEMDRVILSAPTSFGKTLLIKEYIYKKKPKSIVYIVPTNALAYELEKSFKENEHFSEYVIFDKCSTIETINNERRNEEKLFFIGTQEKFLEIDQSVIGEIDLFVIDEAYKLQDSIKYQRAYKLSETFLDSITRNSKKIFLLTPKATLDGFDKYKFYIFKSDFNAVDKNYVVLEKKDFFETLLSKGKKEKTILFCYSPKQINAAYEEIENSVGSEINTEFVKLLETDIHPDWSVVKLLIEIKAKCPNWKFGRNVIESLEDCKSKYYAKTYGGLNVDDLSQAHRLIIGAMKDYGMIGVLKNLNAEILDEIESCLNVRYSTIDVLRAINYLAQNSNNHGSFFADLKKKYMIT